MKTAIVIIVDGVNQKSFEKLRKLGKLPFIDELSKESIEVKKCISIFPSATVSGHASIATCVHPGYHGLVGQSWFDRQSGEFIGYDFELTLPDNWIDASTKLSDEHLTAKTCYDVLRQRGVKTFSVDLIKRADYNFSFIKPGLDRGVGFARFLMFLRRFAKHKGGDKFGKLAKMFLPVFQHEIAVRNTIKAIKLGCRFGIVWFMETDFASHLFSPEKFEGNGKPYVYDSFEDALRDVDEEVEKLYNRVMKITGEKPILALLTDHGQSSLKSGRRYHLDLVEIFSEYNLNAFTNLDLDEYEARTKKKADAVIAVSGPRMAHVYALRNREKVLEVLKSLECVDQIIVKDERIVYHEGEAFRLEEVDEVLGEEYPHAFERIDGLIVSERCGDYIITAKKGYEFEKADYKGAHGSLIYDDSVGFAMIRCGKNLEIEECFITDVVKFVLREFIS